MSVEIKVNNCINKCTIPNVIKAGADILTLGSSGLFGMSKDTISALKEIRELLEVVKNKVSKKLEKMFVVE